MTFDVNYALRLEKFLLEPKVWPLLAAEPDVPAEVLEVLRDPEPQGLGVGVHPKHGWIVLGCGQGPHVLYVERA